MDVVFLVLGLVLLVVGGEGLVRGACGLGLAVRLSPAFVGLTIVAAGTSMPELVVSVQAALDGNVGISVGNVVGSNVFNIGAILGLAALVRPLRVVGTAARLDGPLMLGASLLVVPLLWDGSLGRGEGAVLVVGALVVTAVLGWCGSGGDGDDEGMPTASFGLVGPRALLANIVALVAGVALLGLGSSWLVHGAVGLAAGLGVSETVIGLTIVAAGTSTPELVTSLVAARNGRDDIAIANVIGSNLFNLLGILGLTALVTPLAVPARILTRDLWWMIGLAALLLPMLWRPRLRRVQGLVLLAVFVAYLGLLVWEVS